MNAKTKAIIITAALCLLLSGAFFAGYRTGYPAGHRAGTIDGAAAERRIIEQTAADRSGDISRHLAEALRDATERGDRMEGGIRGAIEASRGIAAIVEQGGSRAAVIERIADEIDRQYTLPNGALTPAQTWGVALGPDSDLDAPLPCQWEGDTEQTPVDLATMFPAEYQYLKTKLQPGA